MARMVGCSSEHGSQGKSRQELGAGGMGGTLKTHEQVGDRAGIRQQKTILSLFPFTGSSLSLFVSPYGV
jgi:hypothetical protein